MRSSSSELLLDEQGELRKRQLQVLTQPKRTIKSTEKSLREQAWFYTTALLVLFSVLSGSSLLFLVPLYVDPALSTLVADFVQEPVTCITSRREDLTGLLNCSWNSCREGCTSDVYRCTHIYVTYDPDVLYSEIQNENLSWKLDSLHMNTTLSIAHSTVPSVIEEAVLLVNIKGCGYPPMIHCTNFTSTYGVEGVEFPCYYSRENRTVVLPHYNQEEHISIILHYFAVPFVITLTTSVALCVMHCDCTCRGSPVQLSKRQNRRPRNINDLKYPCSDGSISTRVDMLTPGSTGQGRHLLPGASSHSGCRGEYRQCGDDAGNCAGEAAEIGTYLL
ncbi:uncharacterized protein LOC123302374 [Chrysoperla carnea]|uniref:uncharacterized protein LOC123302374 n=1 Tax=Chrysoperla carnea TaxID=189513 RepID=UPI001D08D0AD|nr:uncharacterized protein LOC123302374 [Chrysoperla carnea]